MTERSRRVVLLIDYDNLQICAARDTPGRDLQLAPVVQLAQRYGSVIYARAYAEWNLSTERLAVYKAGIEPAFAPVLRTESDRSGKSLADTVMVAEGMDMLWTLSPEVVVLATSDKDLIPLVRVAKQRGAFVVVLGSDFTAIPLREMADEHVTYRQLISDAGVRYATEAGPGRQPAALPEPSRRRRERDRTSAPPPAVSRPEREPAPAPQPSVAAAPAVAAPAAAAAAVSAEPVAPFTASVTGEADAQTSGRRRRRRGSRRRSDRLGLTVEGEGLALEGEDGYEGDETDELTGVVDGELDAEDELTPDIDAAELVISSEGAGLVEAELEAAADLVAAAEAEALAEAIEIEGAPVLSGAGSYEATAVVPQSSTDEVSSETGSPVRERRPRRTRRRVTETPEAASGETLESGVLETAVQAAFEDGGASPSPTSQSSDVEPAPLSAPEATLNGASETPAATPEAPAEPVRRPRRVASAARGRSRRP